MTNLRAAMQRWATAKSWRAERAEAGQHALSRAREFAPMTAEKARKQIKGRDGIGRRTLMGVAAGRVVTNQRGEIVRVLPVPIWACDPVPCKNRGSFVGSEAPITAQSVAWVDPIPDDLHWIDRALAQLERVNRMRAQILREEFMGTGTQTMKARRVADEYGGELTVWQYRKELGKALAFLEVMGT